jgi:type III secretory pathway component EscS
MVPGSLANRRQTVLPKACVCMLVELRDGSIAHLTAISSPIGTTLTQLQNHTVLHACSLMWCVCCLCRLYPHGAHTIMQ